MESLDTKERNWDMPQHAWICRVNGHSSYTLVLKEDWRIVLSSLIATWYREGPAMTQQFNMNHGHPDGDLLTSILAYEWFLANKATYSHKYSDWKNQFGLKNGRLAQMWA